MEEVLSEFRVRFIHESEMKLCKEGTTTTIPQIVLLFSFSRLGEFDVLHVTSSALGNEFI